MLSKASGTRVSYLDKEYFVIGKQPSPPYRTADSGGATTPSTVFQDKPSSSNSTDLVEPDLEGITQMLRMVDEYNDSPINNGAEETNIQDLNTVITISKLNPNVVEFVPRSSHDISDKRNANVANSELDEEKHNRRTSENNSTEACDRRSINTLSNKSISIKDSDEIKEMIEKLKTKITNTFNTSCVKVKKERNLDMAMLIKLHTQPNDEMNNDVQKPKLMTSDYFKTSLKYDAEISDLEKINPNTPMQLDVNIHQAIGIDLCEKEQGDIITDNSTNISNSREENSREKVDDWLNPKINADFKTSAITRPSMYLGPITFKRKNNSKPMSPISVESELKSQHSKQSNEVFVPSTFASELTKKYEEENSREKVDDWLNPNINADFKTSAITRPSMYLGPITFKRKNNSKPMSPISVEWELKSQHSKQSNEVFVPSTFASELTKKYEEENSREKVDDWLNPNINADFKTSAITRPSMYLGPITFKRKNNSKPMSPISVESELKSQHSKQSNEVFVPSTFASELTKKYKERSKVKDSQEQSTNPDIWSKLELDLKVRDEIIKKKLQANAKEQYIFKALM